MCAQICIYILPDYCIRSAYTVTIVLSVALQEGADSLTQVGSGEGGREWNLSHSVLTFIRFSLLWSCTPGDVLDFVLWLFSS